MAAVTAYLAVMETLGRIRKTDDGRIVGGPWVKMNQSGTGLIGVRECLAQLKTVTSVEPRLEAVCRALGVVIRAPLAETAVVVLPLDEEEYWLEIAFLLDSAASQSGRDPDLKTLLEHPHPRIQAAARVLDDLLP